MPPTHRKRRNREFSDETLRTRMREIVDHLLGRSKRPSGFRLHHTEGGATGVHFGRLALGSREIEIAVILVQELVPDSKQLTKSHDLTPREAQVAALLAKRRTNKEISRALGIKPKTAARYTDAVFSKLGVHSRLRVANALNVGT